MKGEGREREGAAIEGKEKTWGSEGNTAGGVGWFHADRRLFSPFGEPPPGTRAVAVRARWVDPGCPPCHSRLDWTRLYL